MPIALVEIKSHEQIEERHIENLKTVAMDYPDAELFCLSLDKNAKRFGNVKALHWQEGLVVLGLA